MFKRVDLWIALVVIGLCGFAVVKQLTYRSDEDIVPLEIGESLDLDIRLTDVSDVEQTVRVGDYTGRDFTVLYTWSTLCPCVGELEPRMRALHLRFNEKRNGVGWLAIDGEPTDNRKMIRRYMTRLGSFYRLLRDPEQQVTRRLGFQSAVQVAVIDSHGVLRYRGSVDDAYEAAEVKTNYLGQALEALVAGKEPPQVETAWVYGCTFSDPASCEFYKKAAKPDKPAKTPAETPVKTPVEAPPQD